MSDAPATTDALIEVLNTAADQPAPDVTEAAPEAKESPDVAEALQGLKEKVDQPPPEALRAEQLAVLREKRLKLQEARQAAKQKAQYEELLKNASGTKEAYTKELTEWSESFKDPKQVIKAFEKRGVDPYTLWNTLSEGIIGETTPEVAKAREYEKLQQETLAKVNPEVEAMKKEMAEMKKAIEEYKREREEHGQAQVQATRQEFVNYLMEDPEAEELFDYYTPEQVVSFGTQLSQALAQQGEEATFRALKLRMIDAHKQYVLSLENRRQDRLKRRQPANPAEAATSSAQKTPTKSTTKTISNKLATEANRPHPEPEEDEEQRKVAVRGDLKNLLRLG